MAEVGLLPSSSWLPCRSLTSRARLLSRRSLGEPIRASNHIAQSVDRGVLGDPWPRCLWCASRLTSSRCARLTDRVSPPPLHPQGLHPHRLEFVPSLTAVVRGLSLIAPLPFPTSPGEEDSAREEGIRELEASWKLSGDIWKRGDDDGGLRADARPLQASIGILLAQAKAQVDQRGAKQILVGSLKHQHPLQERTSEEVGFLAGLHAETGACRLAPLPPRRLLPTPRLTALTPPDRRLRERVGRVRRGRLPRVQVRADGRAGSAAGRAVAARGVGQGRRSRLDDDDALDAGDA